MTLSAQLRTRLREFSVDVELQVGRETLVIVGPSGCGKTTTLRMLAGLLNPSTGRISLEGRTLFDSENAVALPPERRSVGVVFQNYALFPHLSVAANVGYGLRGLTKADRDRRVAQALQRVRITPLAHARPATLSGGEQQRVAVARALVTEPRMLLLDEPLSALDVQNRAHLRRELAGLLQELAIPTIVVTHDLADAEVLADRIAVMDRGRIVQAGSPQEVISRPANAFVAQFTGTNVIPAELVDAGIAPGAMLAVDPARVVLSTEPVGGGLGWAATVVSVQPRGEVVRVGLDLPAHTVAEVAPGRDGATGFQIGDQVTARVDPADTRQLVVTTGHDTQTGDSAASRRRFRPRRRDPAGHQHVAGTRLHRTVATLLTVITGLVVVSAMAVAPPSRSVGAAAAGGKAVTAFVAANATEPFNQVIQEFQSLYPGEKVQASYTGTQILYTQMEQGAPVDVFLSADEAHAQQAVAAGLIPQYFPVSRTLEVIVVPKNNPAGVTELRDLGTKPAKLVIGVPTVPIGIYTRQILGKANSQYGATFSDQVLKNVVSTETDVKQVAHKVALGEADAGIVYRTDINAELAKQVDIIAIPDAFQVIATNYVGAATHAPHPAQAQQLLDYLLGAQGKAAFAKFGYLPLTDTPAAPAPVTPAAPAPAAPATPGAPPPPG